MRRLILKSACLIGVLVIGVVLWNSYSSHPRTNGVRRPASFTTDAQIEITGDPSQVYDVRVLCLSALASENTHGGSPWETAACGALRNNPNQYTGDAVIPDCWGGGWPIELHITGEINDHRVDIRQDGKCGPESTYQWRHLLYLYRMSLDLPPWVVQWLI